MESDGVECNLQLSFHIKTSLASIVDSGAGLSRCDTQLGTPPTLSPGAMGVEKKKSPAPKAAKVVSPRKKKSTEKRTQKSTGDMWDCY